MKNNKENSDFTEDKNDGACLPVGCKMPERSCSIQYIKHIEQETLAMQKKIEELEKENSRYISALEDIGFCKTWFILNNPQQLVTWALDGLRATGGLSHMEILEGKISSQPYESKLAIELEKKDDQLLNSQSQIELLAEKVKKYEKAFTQLDKAILKTDNNGWITNLHKAREIINQFLESEV